jgi:hypothetical protein
MFNKKKIVKELVLILIFILTALWGFYLIINSAKKATDEITESFKKPAQQSPQITSVK